MLQILDTEEAQQPCEHPVISVDSVGFSVEQVELGSREAELHLQLGSPLKREEQPTQFCEIERGYYYKGLYVHVTDGIVEMIILDGATYSLDNGIVVGLLRSAVDEILGFESLDSVVTLQMGQSDCWVYLSFSEEVLSEIRETCAG